MNDRELIAALGGPTSVAKMLGYELPDGARRVHNWIQRGIPSAVKVAHPGIFMRRRAIKAQPQQAAHA